MSYFLPPVLPPGLFTSRGGGGIGLTASTAKTRDFVISETLEQPIHNQPQTFTHGRICDIISSSYDTENTNYCITLCQLLMKSAPELGTSQQNIYSCSTRTYFWKSTADLVLNTTVRVFSVAFEPGPPRGHIIIERVTSNIRMYLFMYALLVLLVAVVSCCTVRDSS